MHRYAHVLATLNGGQASVDIFILEHPIFKKKEVFGDPVDCLKYILHHPKDPSNIPSYAFSGSITLAPSVEFFEKLSTAVNKQKVVVEQVFPPSVNVLAPFLERVAELVVAEYVAVLLDETHERGIELYLKAASGLYEQLLQFQSRISSEIFGKVFDSHIDLYLQEELHFFTKASDDEVGQWEKRLSEQDASAESFFMSNINRQADKRDFLSSFKKVVMMPVNVVAMPFTPKAVATITPEEAPTPGEAPTSELAAKAAIVNSKLENIRSLFSLEIALNLVHMAKSSLERAAIFVNMGGQYGEEAREQSEMIFVHLLQVLGTRHIKTGFDKAVDHLSKYNPRDVTEHKPGVPPLVMFLELVNVGDLIQQMIDVFYEQELVAMKLTDRNDFLDPAVKEKKRFEQMLDERVAAGLNKGIDVLMDEVEYLCATTQKTTDFNPTSDISEVGTTETAEKIVDIVSAHTKMLVGSTDKTMLDVFNQEVGLRLFGALCKHLKRQRISVDGSMRLISDMSHYFGYIETLRNNDLLTYFKALRELSQIYLIGPGDAKEMAAIIADGDRFFGVFRAEEVYEFAQRRADWYHVKGRVEKAMYGAGCTVM
jgi:recyclin-1